MAVSFANIFMAEIETKLIQQGKIKPREWKLRTNSSKKHLKRAV